MPPKVHKRPHKNFHKKTKRRQLSKIAPVSKPTKPSCIDRIVDSVPYPETRKLTAYDVFNSTTKKPITSKLIEHFQKEGRLQESVAVDIIEASINILRNEATLLELNGPINICGDIHGQFFDLVRLFNIGGYPPSQNYLFLGDYVDRGPYGIEVILCLFAMKINYPDNVFLLRGNHECRHVTEKVTFKRECEIKYSEELYLNVMTAFDCLPLAATINQKYICMHGGISPDIYTLTDIKKINRFREIPTFGPMCDLLWSDPAPDYGDSLCTEYFTQNTARGISYYFSYEACCDFLNRNKLLSVIRAHQVQFNGIRMYETSKQSGCSSVITIFSAPKYLDVHSNKGAFLHVDKNISVKQFADSPRPYWLPNLMDVFSWSLPYLEEFVIDILRALLNFCSDVELLGDENYREDEVKLRHEIIRKKLRDLG